MRKAMVMATAAVMIGGAAYAWQVRPVQTDTVTYVATVEAGDTVWDLAARLARPENDIRDVVRAIKEQNGIRDARDLQPGQTLRVTVARAQ